MKSARSKHNRRIHIYLLLFKRLNQQCFFITLTRESERKCRSPKKNLERTQCIFLVLKALKQAHLLRNFISRAKENVSHR